MRNPVETVPIPAEEVLEDERATVRTVFCPFMLERAISFLMEVQ
jgi:hypothetical protein